MTGTLKGYDQLLNLVMDDVVEEFEGESMSAMYHGRESTDPIKCAGVYTVLRV